ncbi:MAG TPA: hypothetical protein VGD35_10840, partial [Chitinophaga sp.]
SFIGQYKGTSSVTCLTSVFLRVFPWKILFIMYLTFLKYHVPMKRFVTGILIMLISASVSMAQTPDKKKTADKKDKTEQTTAANKPVKKDGTPDKRYKVNKTDIKGPVKKDGSPDMRYKSNKDGAKKS